MEQDFDRRGLCRRTWNLEGKVQRGEQDGEENPPAEQAGDKGKGAAGDDERGGACGVAHRAVPEGGGEAAEGADQGEEDHDEDEVCAEGADHVDEAEDSHPQEEEAWLEDGGQRMGDLGFGGARPSKGLPRALLNSGALRPVPSTVSSAA